MSGTNKWRVQQLKIAAPIVHFSLVNFSPYYTIARTVTSLSSTEPTITGQVYHCICYKQQSATDGFVA